MDYQKQATDFLTSHGLEFRAVLVGSDCPLFCEDARAEKDMDKIEVFPRRSHIHGKHYRCTISGKDRGHVSFEFWNSYADEEQKALAIRRFSEPHLYQKYKGKQHPKVTAYDLLACVQKYDVGTLADFCADFGYDTDSRRAEQVYIAVCQEYQKMRKFFTAEELTQLQDIS